MKRVIIWSLLLLSYAAGAQNISTLAGSLSSGFTGDGGAATDAQLFHPKGMATDDSGNVYIADADNNVIRKVSPSGVISTIAGYPAGGFSGDGGLAVYAGLSRPNCVVIDPMHNIYISDADNQRIRKIDTAGVIHTIVGNGTPGFTGDGGAATAAEINYPGGIALDKYGNLYITDEYNNRIRKVDTAGIITTFAGSGSTGYPGDEEFADTAAIGFPFGIAVDTAGNVFCSLTLDNRIIKITPSRIITSVAGVGGGTGGFGGDGGPATAAQFDNPWGIALDVFGNLYIADNANERIRMVNTAGNIATVAGNGSSGFSGDGGLATLAKIKDPAGVHIDAMGNMYIADYNNHRVRKVNGSPTLGVRAPGAVSMLLFPDPADGAFSVSVTAAVPQVVDLSVTDVMGHVVRQLRFTSGQPAHIQLAVPPGTYFVHAVTSSGSISQRIVINN